MKKIYQQWQLVVYDTAQDVLTTSGEREGKGYAWKSLEWQNVDDNPWN